MVEDERDEDFVEKKPEELSSEEAAALSPHGGATSEVVGKEVPEEASHQVNIRGGLTHETHIKKGHHKKKKED
ncbi:MAG TPA: hypothetical protein PLU88_11015 [Armatimonadota bacterium]|jgi:hypothetical protein|nr:hypothetical protein [Armatimonadota bacterium]HPP75640.1 hypothetical protein [Armatimonadota bacterium]